PKEPLLLSTINPFALAEVVARKRFRWNKMKNPHEKLAEILNVSQDKLFAHDSVILNPTLCVEQGKARHLKHDEARRRMRHFMEAETKHRLHHGAGRRMRIKGLTLENTTERVMEAITLKSDDESTLSEQEIKKNTKEEFTPIGSTIDEQEVWNPSGMVWADKGSFFQDHAEWSDPMQGALGDCYFICSLCSVAWSRPYVIVNATCPSDDGNEDNPYHQVSFYNDKNKLESVEVTELLPVQAETLDYKFARSSEDKEVWPAVMEKAYVKWRTGGLSDQPFYELIEAGDPVEACRHLIGGKKTYRYTANSGAQQIFKFVTDNSLFGRTVNPMVAWTYPAQPEGYNYADAHLVAGHAYSILGHVLTEDETRYIVLRNPWGTYGAVQGCLEGTFSSQTNKYMSSIKLGENGVFAMEVSVFKKLFAGMGVVK
ncbi:MAG: hypothetical protein HUJ99_04120, partial [Bacteroidaceae bacterium]|nr:hypothetical protein [Bacteroidaceae bacterium]